MKAPDKTGTKRGPSQAERIARNRKAQGRKPGKSRKPTAPERRKREPEKRRRPNAEELRKKKTEERRKAAAAEHRRRPTRSKLGKRPRYEEDLPEVIYTPPRPFNRNRFLRKLLTLVAVVLALTFVCSLFFKVKVITVSGAVKYDAWTVRQASGIELGEGLLTFGRARANGKIQAALPYVERIRIGIKLPDTVNIEIVETDVVYAIAAADETLWLMSAEGKILEQVEAKDISGLPMLTGIKLAVPVGQQAQAHEETMYNPFGETIPPEMTAQERLNILKQILQALEKNGSLGKVSIVDVSNPENLYMWFGEEYQIKLGDSSRLDYKIASMVTAFEQEQYLEPGLMDVSYSERPNEVVFAPFRQS